MRYCCTPVRAGKYKAMEMPNAGVKLEKLDVPCIVCGTVKCHSRSGKHLEISLETERALATRPSSLPCVRVPQRENDRVLYTLQVRPLVRCARGRCSPQCGRCGPPYIPHANVYGSFNCNNPRLEMTKKIPQ